MDAPSIKVVWRETKATITTPVLVLQLLRGYPCEIAIDCDDNVSVTLHANLAIDSQEGKSPLVLRGKAEDRGYCMITAVFLPWRQEDTVRTPLGIDHLVLARKSDVPPAIFQVVHEVGCSGWALGMIGRDITINPSKPAKRLAEAAI